MRRLTSLLSMERYYVYVLLSQKDGKMYIGVTKDLRKRLHEHARGAVDATRYRRYLRLIRYEYFISKEDAEARERFLKSGYGHRQLREILKRTLAKEETS